MVAFAVSAIFSGLSGAMLIFYLATVSVGTVVDLTIGAQVIIAAVMGGRRTILGAASMKLRHRFALDIIEDEDDEDDLEDGEQPQNS